MGRSLRLLNLALAVVAVLIATALAKTWVSPAASIPDRPVPKLSQEATPLAFAPLARPPLAQFDVIVEKNPFKQPPLVPPPRIGLQKPALPPAPLPTLVGTILVDEERRAIISDKGKQGIYAVSQEVAGGVIIEIKEDRIMYKRGDESVDIFLKTAIETVPSTGGHPVVSPSPVLPLPTAPPSVKASPFEKQMFKQEQRTQKQQEKMLRKQFKSR